MSDAPESRDVDDLLADHAATNSLAALAATTPRDDDGEPDLTSQGEERTADAPRVTMHTAGRVDRHPIGHAVTLLVALAGVYAGVVVELTAPLASGGQLIAGPVLMLGGAALLARLVHVTQRRAHR
ncbi:MULTISPECIES: hypothetical protein [unclassified Isoptericola]|uniref:hypothetical protein n=1 Tax=unclassified Isoptericola TaxID=2623355 RepID=UPI00365A257B